MEKISGKKRRILVDTPGLLLHAMVHAASIQDRDGGLLVLSTLWGCSRSCASCLPMAAIKAHDSRPAWPKCCPSSVEIVKRSDFAKGFEIIPKRWVATFEESERA